MTAKRDYYEVLGVDRSADEKALKKAYRKLAEKNIILIRIQGTGTRNKDLRK